jgi:NAD(P)-dependent dehydrogenase (short-subunit alcohol dehydrogenase family)
MTNVSAPAGANKCMLITGGSRGIGAATARMAARAGYRVAINYMNSVGAALGLAEEIVAAGGEAQAFQADVGRQDQVGRLFEQVDSAFGAVDVLVNNAGVLTSCRVDRTEEPQLLDVFRTNVFSAFFCSHEAVRRMSTMHGGRGGAIINVSSVAARLGGQSGGAQYAASKGAIDSFTNALSKEVGAEGIRVNGVRPGLIVTDIHNFHQDAGPDGIARRASTVPLRRAGQPDEVAEVILWLASDAASYVHGAIVDVSGGR